MKSWKEVKSEVSNISEERKKELDFEIDIMSQLIERRLNLKISQRKLAELSNLEQSTIARYEKNKISPKLNSLFRILEALDLEIIIKNKDKYSMR